MSVMLHSNGKNTIFSNLYIYFMGTYFGRGKGKGVGSFQASVIFSGKKEKFKKKRNVFIVHLRFSLCRWISNTPNAFHGALKGAS